MGHCNICGNFGKLTEDHTPPKGCIKIKQVELHHILMHLDVEQPSHKGRISQNGVKFRTLCGKCNNDYLGINYDPSFISFVNQIGLFLKTTISIPGYMKAKIKPQRVMRSLLGHISAQGVGRYHQGAASNEIQSYFLNEEESLPERIKIYFWAYPYKSHVMARDCVLTDLTVGEPVAFWLLKFFPISFMVTFNEPDKYNFNMEALSKFGKLGIDDEVEVNVDLENIIHQMWPEAPTDKSVVMYGNDAIASYDWRYKS